MGDDFGSLLEDSVRSWTSQQVSDTLMRIYQTLYNHFGELGWWPAETPEEVIIGAILVQNVSWQNTEKAIAALRAHSLLSFAAIYEAPLETIGACVRATRYYHTKAKKLKAFAHHLMQHYGGNLDSMLRQPLEPLRAELLSIWGIGPETADDILLYAAGHASFVIDAYTRRIFHRLGLIREKVAYEPLRAWFMAHLPADAALFNRYHAMLDAVGHRYCLAARPRCGDCPLASFCVYARQGSMSTS
jgi:endonuclease-3 related protein